MDTLTAAEIARRMELPESAVGVTTALLAAVLLLTHTPAGQARQAASSTQPRTASTAPGLTRRSRWSTSGATG